MIDIIEKVFESNPWMNALNLFLAILGAFLSIVFYLRSIKVKKPYCLTSSTNVISNSMSEITSLEIFYKKERVTNLTKTKLVFWNAGKETLTQNDIPTSEPMTICVENGLKILNAKIIFVKNKSNQINIKKEKNRDNKFYIEFEYIDRDEGAIIEIVHTGTSDSDVKIDGKFKGAEPLQRNSMIGIDNLPKILKFALTNEVIRSALIAGLITGPLVNIALKYYGLLLTAKNPYEDAFNWVTVILLALLFWWLARYLSRTNIPNGFDLSSN